MRRILRVCWLAAAATGVAAGAPPGYGISSWAGWKPGQISRADCPELRSVPLILKWETLESAPGRYAFEEELGRPLKAAQADGLHVTLMIWVGPAAPQWIYQNGVPRVITDRKVNALGQKTDGQKEYPYYLHPEYKKRFSGLIEAFGKYVMALPLKLRERIVFVQCAEGSGDVGRWNIDESIHGRFGRAFAHQSGKKQMRFQLDPAFAARELKVSVTYLDQGTGSWSIGLPGQASAMRIQNANSGKWRTQAVTLPRFAELVLSYEAGDDTVFHLLEVERAGPSAVSGTPGHPQRRRPAAKPEVGNEDRE